VSFCCLIVDQKGPAPIGGSAWQGSAEDWQPRRAWVGRRCGDPSGPLCRGRDALEVQNTNGSGRRGRRSSEWRNSTDGPEQRGSDWWLLVGGWRLASWLSRESHRWTRATGTLERGGHLGEKGYAVCGCA
jgi:hypothetical protein